MNPINNIEIKNFKSIRHQKIEDCRRINVFIGYPNVGKSNILEAIGLYSSFRLAGEVFKLNDICRVQRFSELFFNKDYRNAVNIEINKKLKLELIITQSNELEIRIHSSHLQEDSRSTQIYSATVASSNYTFQQKDSINEIPFSEITGPIKKYDFQAADLFRQKTPRTLAVPFGANLLEVLHGDSVLRREVAALFEEYDLKLVLDDDEISFFKSLEDDTVVRFPYYLVADTLKRLIFYKAAILSDQGAVLLFEEPEAHMFPPYISKFTSDIWYYKDNQYFISTQSPFVVNDFLENVKEELAIYVVEYDRVAGETIIKRLTEEQIHEAYQYGIDIFFNLESITK